ncbi:MAG TPA: M56 family metallopeptidase [Bryobacteraceae bacterium]|nr:M56 family metallopeptidase [Bryobacteraceae bacterium]
MRRQKLLPPTGRDARLLFSSEVSSPIAVGFGKPAVILPVSLASDLDKADFDHVVLHEAAHLARMDDWTNLAARALEAVLALHPVVLWVLGRIEREREMACDEWVVVRTGQARSYAASLARMYELRWTRHEEALASGVFGRGSRVVGRIELLARRGREFSGRVSARRLVFSMFVLLALVAAGSRAPRWIAFAQSTPRPSFEVASVKPGNPNSGRFGFGRRSNEFIADNAPLSILISAAYNVQVHQIFGGPKWVNTDRFTIEAKPNAATPIPEGPEGMNQLNLMLQSLLQERFKLALHRETRTEQVYELVVAKGGPKLIKSAGPGADSRTGIWNTDRPGEVAGYDVAVANLVALVSQRLGAPVVDKTGLSAKYDFKLSFMVEPTQQDRALFGAPPPEAVPPADSGLPSIFTALQDQLGLKLEATKGPVEVLVIDSAEKPEPN